MRKILILYISENSGHHSAAIALESALKTLDPSVSTMCVDPINYTHPKLSAIIHHTYMVIIRRTPELWDTLYDNRHFDMLTKNIRGLIQRGKSKPFLRMMDTFQPDTVICTQAYPFGVMHAYLEHSKKDISLWGVITDYRPHRFWVYQTPAHYITPTGSAADRLAALGIKTENISPLGIPINPLFMTEASAATAPAKRQIAVMGGNHGLGIKVGLIKKLDKSTEDFTMHIVTGKNRRLCRMLMLQKSKFKHSVKIRGYVRAMPKLMRESSLLISKPGGLTCAEATASGLPMIITHALPGQEAGNASELVGSGAAIRIKKEREIGPVVSALLENTEILAMMQARARAIGKPDAAFKIANHVLRGI